MEDEWARIVALDAGPKKKPATREEAQLIARSYLLLQKKALEEFLAKYPRETHAFDAKLRLAAIAAALGEMSGDDKQIAEALRTLTALESAPGIPTDQLANASFQKVSLIMQSQKGAPAQVREVIVAAAKNFTAKYPGDKRGPRLLVEAATICDDVPSQKREILEEASRITTEEGLKRRIADDLTRLDLMARPLNLKATALDGKEIDLAKLRGNVVVIIFWAAESPHSLLWMRDFRAAWETLPKDGVTVITISLDKDRKALNERLKDLPTTWPAYFDGKGWEGTIARGWGINALPTVWILDKKGLIRSLNAKTNYDALIRQLVKE